MVDFRTNYAKEIYGRIGDDYGEQIRIFETCIPVSVKTAEASAQGISVYKHCPKNKVAIAYQNLTKEVLNYEK